MRMKHVMTAAAMTLRESARNRLVLVLGLLLPLVFFAIVFATTRTRSIPVEIGESSASQPMQTDERRVTLIFIGLAAAGLLAAFFAANLVQRRIDTDRRLVLCGYRAVELLAARVAILLVIVAVASVYVALLLFAVTAEPARAGVVLGIVLGAFVYGCYGLVAGTALRHDLATIFAIVVLTNIDLGWLQNPVVYHGAQNRWVIRALPGYFPAQTAFLAELTNESLGMTVVRALTWGIALLLGAALLYIHRMRLRR
jgi:hypothetical protein